jgi:hypothetical protein
LSAYQANLVLGDTIMNTVAIVELKRDGWRQKVVKSSFVMFGKSPYVELIKPKKWDSKLRIVRRIHDDSTKPFFRVEQ